MNYVSTRNNKNELNFKDVFIKGLADDGGSVSYTHLTLPTKVEV